MKSLVIGHLSIDVYHDPDGASNESFGGMVPVLKILASLAEKGDRIIPVCGVHADDHQSFLTALQGYPAIDTAGVFRQPGPTHRVHYYPKGGGYSNACTKEVADPIPFARIRDLLNTDGILINMFSGFDITLETLDNIRMAVRPRGTPIHLDYHNLTLGLTPGGERVRRPLPEWRRWAFMVDTVQCNEAELAGLDSERLTEQQMAGHILTLGVKGVIVTRAERGATLFLNEKRQVHRHDVVPENENGSGDLVGMGDLLGAAFHLHYLRKPDLLAALRAAHRVVATAAPAAGLSE